MEHLLLSETTIFSKDLTIGSARLGENIIAEANQSSASIYIPVKGDQEFPFESQKSGNKMSVDFGRNTDEKIGTNLSTTIGIPRRHINRTSLSNCEIFDSIRRVSLCHGKIKSESENLVENLRGKMFLKTLTAKVNS